MSNVLPVYLFDSFALLAYLEDEKGAGRVQELLLQSQAGKCQLIMCQINLGEVLYITERERRLHLAQRVLALVEGLPIHLVEASRDLILDAAHLKAHYPLAYADAFAAATALRENATLLTGDPEFESLKDLIIIEWLER